MSQQSIYTDHPESSLSMSSQSVPTIDVGVLSSREINASLEGEFQCLHTEQRCSGRIKARIDEDVIVVVDESGTSIAGKEVVLEPASKTGASFTLFGVTIGVSFHWERNEDQRFVGSLKLLLTDAGITAINSVSVEDYLTSVISSEMSAESSVHLLKAHAVTSRSWLLAQIEKSRSVKKNPVKYQTLFEDDQQRIRWYDREDHVHFDVCADVVTFHGTICDARFSKSCGGVTELFENAWEPVHYPYLTPVVDSLPPPSGYSMDLTNEKAAEAWIRGNPPAFCNTTDKAILSQVLLKYDQETTDFYRWKVAYGQSEIAELIGKRSGIDFGAIIDLVPIERGASGRIIKLKIVGTKKTYTIGKELEIRKTLSRSHLYSSAFVVDKKDVRNGIPGRFTLTGAGWGHGVGLCQIGAAVMGE
ncbi:MAG: amidase, partial [Bacteroidetes bacterium]|nr:amidase [Bacteroidota bacterium]